MEVITDYIQTPSSFLEICKPPAWYRTRNLHNKVNITKFSLSNILKFLKYTFYQYWTISNSLFPYIASANCQPVVWAYYITSTQNSLSSYIIIHLVAENLWFALLLVLRLHPILIFNTLYILSTSECLSLFTHFQLLQHSIYKIIVHRASKYTSRSS